MTRSEHWSLQHLLAPDSCNSRDGYIYIYYCYYTHKYIYIHTIQGISRTARSAIPGLLCIFECLNEPLVVSVPQCNIAHATCRMPCFSQSTVQQELLRHAMGPGLGFLLRLKGTKAPLSSTTAPAWKESVDFCGKHLCDLFSLPCALTIPLCHVCHGRECKPVPSTCSEGSCEEALVLYRDQRELLALR